VEKVDVGGRVELQISEIGTATGWRAYPDDVVGLAPAEDGRGCVATGLKVGQATVKATGIDGRAVGHFSVLVSTPGAAAAPEPTAAQAPPTATQASAQATPAAAATTPATVAP
jgi:hypothetical protein